MPKKDFLVKILSQISQDFISINVLISQNSNIQKIYLIRSILWLNKFDIVEIATK